MARRTGIRVSDLNVQAPSTTASDDGRKIHIKGNQGVVTIDIIEIRTTVRTLQTFYNVKPADLPGDIKTKFHDFKSLLESLRSTPQAYDVVYEEVKVIFDANTDVIPGTVGAYLNGCLVDTQIDGNRSCAVVCANSTPSSSAWSACEDYVLVAEPLNEGQYKFISYNDSIQNKSKAIIYVAEGHNFSGFCHDARSSLITAGVKEAKVYHYSRDGRTYTPLTSGYEQIGNLQYNGIVTNDGSNVFQWVNTNSNWVWWVIIIAIIVIILLVIAARRRSSS